MSRGEAFPGIVLVGFMGSGKSSVGRELARRFGVPFVDVDAWIEAAAGCRIRDLFAREGEPAFREREKAALREVLSVKGCVIATGGGAFADEENRVLLRSYAPVVYLDTAVETLLERLSADLGRPLLRGGDREEVVYGRCWRAGSPGIAPPTSRCGPTGERWRKSPDRWRTGSTGRRDGRVEP